MHKVYKIDKYANKNRNFIENEYTEYTADDLAIELENDHGYHMRITSAKNYIFFGDCDKFDGTFDKFENYLIDFLNDYYRLCVKWTDISYTENEGVKGSFHYSIPSLYASCKKLKEIHENFFL